MDFEIEQSAPPAPAEPALPPLRSAKLKSDAAITAALPSNTVLWQSLRWMARIALYAGVILFVAGKFFVAKFDEKLIMERALLEDPTQEPINQPPFRFDYRGHSYRIEPVASYDISGLVVTHNNISSVFDSYHTKDSVDFRDVCLVWGDNVRSGIFRAFKFFSMPWSCHFNSDNRDALAVFRDDQVSNNHLLSSDEKIRALVNTMKIGDQIRLRGMLINYWPEGESERKRTSSTTREDTGNGACEVMWVSHAEILRSGGSNWKLMESCGTYLLISAVALNILLFLCMPLGQYRKFRH